MLLATGAVLLAADWWIGLPAQSKPQYVGRQECVACHEEEVRLWAGSDHDRAMDLATPDTVLGEFDDCDFTQFGVTSRLFRRGQRYCATTDGPTGQRPAARGNRWRDHARADR